MSAYFTLDLDTAAPQVTWGDPNGALAGQTLVVPYSSVELIVAATVTLLDGRVLEANVTDSAITVALPADTPNGTLTVHAIRDLGNYAALTTPVLGVIVLTRERPPGRPWDVVPPRDRQRTRRRQIVQRETAVARNTTSVKTRRASTVTAASRSSTRIRTTTASDVRAIAAMTASTRARVRSVDGTRVDVTAVIERRDGDTIAALIALGLL